MVCIFRRPRQQKQNLSPRPYNLPSAGRFRSPQLFNLSIGHIEGFEEIVNELQFVQRGKTCSFAEKRAITVNHGAPHLKFSLERNVRRLHKSFNNYGVL